MRSKSIRDETKFAKTKHIMNSRMKFTLFQNVNLFGNVNSAENVTTLSL